MQIHLCTTFSIFISDNAGNLNIDCILEFHKNVIALSCAGFILLYIPLYRGIYCAFRSLPKFLLTLPPAPYEHSVLPNIYPEVISFDVQNWQILYICWRI